MFDELSEKLEATFARLRGRGVLTEADIKDGLREVRRVLLEADVNFQLTREFLERVEKKAVGVSQLKAVSPAQQLIKIVYDELTAMLGERREGLKLSSIPPTIVVMVGLQGSGKTTTAAKLARRLKGEGRATRLIAADVYRPAAIDQLERVASQAGAGFYRAPEGTAPRDIAAAALDDARKRGFDFFIVDTAGRLHIDETLMAELAELKRTVRAHSVLLVVDGMIGQESVRVGQAFADQVGVDGLVLTKMDGDARGGAALSLRHVTGKPILFLGVGEKLEGLEVFDAGRLAGRILGMGDVIGLVEKAQAAVSEQDAMRMAERMRKNDFTLEDFLEQLRSVRKMGPLEDVLKMLPGMPKDAIAKLGPQKDTMKHYEAILLSMTLKERRNPRLLDGSRRRRIAAGSGRTVPEVNRLLRDFEGARTMMKALKKGPRGLAGLRGRMR